MTQPSYAGLLLDLDGTLLDSGGRVRPANRAALERLERAGVRVMVVTGRSLLSARDILDDLALEAPGLVFNGAAVWCPREQRLLEERVLSNRVVARGLDYARRGDLLTVAMRSDAKLGLVPRDEVEKEAISFMEGLQYVGRDELRTDFTIRLTFFSDRHETSDVFEREVEAAIGAPTHLTSFPLSILPNLRSNPLTVVDVHPPCRGKAEALRVLEELYDVPAERVVAIGDASNDVPMLAASGLAVAMQDSMDEALAVADRVIGSNDSDAIAELVDELFPSAVQPTR